MYSVLYEDEKASFTFKEVKTLQDNKNKPPESAMRNKHKITQITFIKTYMKDSKQLTQPNANGRLFPVPNGTVAIGGDQGSLRSQTTPRSQPAVPSPPAT